MRRWSLLALVVSALGCGDSASSAEDADVGGDDVPKTEVDRTPDDDVTPDAGFAVDAGFAADAGFTADVVAPRDVIVALDVPAPRDVPLPVDVPVLVDVPPPRDVPAPTVPPQTGLLLQGSSPLPCADPAVFRAANAEGTYYTYCTGMSHVWVTSDWGRFDDRRFATTFDLAGMPANGRSIGAWWAPGIVYAPDLRRYVMWVSVPDARATHDASGWNTRSLAVLTADAPTGPWTYRNLGLAATAAGQHFIDPFLFRDHDGRRYVFFKRYGGGVSSSIMGAALDANWQHITAGTQVEIMNGYGGTGTWEDNVRENPAVDYDPATGHHHLLFSGAHWDDDSYATGHSLSTCGPLCLRAGAGWHFVASGDRGITQVVRANGDTHFTHGGPGGAVFQDDGARFIVYAAAARSARGDTTRYLMRQAIRWHNDAPYVDTAGHHPEL